MLTAIEGNKTRVISKVYTCVYDGEITLQEDEVDEAFFASIEDIRELMKKEKFCSDDIPVFNKLMEELRK